MKTRLGTLTIHFQIPAMTDSGKLLDTQVFHISEEILGIGFALTSSNTVCRDARERLAAATHRYKTITGLRAGSLTLQVISGVMGAANSTHHCSGQDVVIEIASAKQWQFVLCSELLHAKDVVEGHFPSIHRDARVRWVEAMRALSVEGRLADRGMRRVPERHGGRVTPVPTIGEVRRNLLDTIVWAGKRNGLSISSRDAESIAEAVWGKEVTLRHVVELGNRFGLRLEGPLASIPLADHWGISNDSKPQGPRDARATDEVPVA